MNTATATTEEVLGTKNEEVQADKDLTPPAVVEQPSEDAEPTDKKVQQGEELTGFAKRVQRLEKQMAEQYALQLNAAKAEAEYWKQQAAATKQPQEEAKTRLDFATDDDWIEYRLRAERERLLQEAQAAAQQTLQVERVVSTYQQRVNEAKKEFPDWEAVFNSAAAAGATLPEDTVNFCLESDAGARIAYHLAKNESEYQAIMAMSPVRRIAYLGKLEDKLSKKPAAPTPQVSKAPPKLADVKTGGTTRQPATGFDRFASKQAWREWRAANKR
jgi:hypothetical protein